MTDHTASLEESNAARLPLGYRDSCSALLIPLNKCRRKTFYAPWACEEERHTYERCQYQDFLNRQKKLQQLVAEKNSAAAEDL
ncbi:hypothetical protein MEQU1_002455 [Malassezia equina]|uniref:NADH dehydrogenase [ubiquinone] 1 beta subcomplex subunit 7 n=1 Tax=Malassezia equina TaxID=1381935 RepID=A0AAF0EJ76_9BASI|nr:hypothetical protein MEQU1_002455 [Malassezia equina]